MCAGVVVVSVNRRPAGAAIHNSKNPMEEVLAVYRELVEICCRGDEREHRLITLITKAENDTDRAKVLRMLDVVRNANMRARTRLDEYRRLYPNVVNAWEAENKKKV